MNISAGIQSLKDSGLNIFLSIKVSDLQKDLYPFREDQKNKTLCLIASGGRSLWENLPHPLDVTTHPIDFYTQKKMQEFAEVFLRDEIEILYPSDHLIIPLQKIGRAMNLCTQSPIGLDIHPDFGLWFAFRGIFLTRKDITDNSIGKRPALCETCALKPCLKTSDLNAARMMCPEKTEHRYTSFQIDYHANALDILKL